MNNSGTDWDRLEKMTDAEIYKNAISDPDNPPLDDKAVHVRMKDVPGENIMEKYKNLREKKCKQLVTIRYDQDILDYFRAKGKGYQSIINDALRAFMEAEIAQNRSTTTA